MADFNTILSRVEQGDPQAAAELLPLLYDELRQLAAARLAQEKPGQTLQATALVHEAYLRLVHGASPNQWDGRGHFFAAAAEAMRRILVDNARRKQAIKHGGGVGHVSLNDVEIAVDAPPDEVLAVDSALEALAIVDPQAAQVVKLHFFAGVTLENIAPLLQISVRTVHRDWAFARAWLATQLQAARG